MYPWPGPRETSHTWPLNSKSLNQRSTWAGLGWAGQQARDSPGGTPLGSAGPAEGSRWKRGRGVWEYAHLQDSGQTHPLYSTAEEGTGGEAREPLLQSRRLAARGWPHRPRAGRGLGRGVLLHLRTSFIRISLNQRDRSGQPEDWR